MEAYSQTLDPLMRALLPMSNFDDVFGFKELKEKKQEFLAGKDVDDLKAIGDKFTASLNNSMMIPMAVKAAQADLVRAKLRKDTTTTTTTTP